MRKFLYIAAAALSFISASSAFAQTFASTPGWYPFSGSGVKVQKGNGPILYCDVSFMIVNDGTDITVESPSISGFFGLCDTIILSGHPWPVTISAATVTIGDIADPIDVNTNIIPGDCVGVIDAKFDISPISREMLTIDFGFPTSPGLSTLPARFLGTGDCNVDGSVHW